MLINAFSFRRFVLTVAMVSTLALVDCGGSDPRTEETDQPVACQNVVGCEK